MNKIVIKTIPHKDQNYDTAGDYKNIDNNWFIYVSEMPKWEYEMLIAVHELIEAILTHKRGIKWGDIDYFDMITAKGNRDPGTNKKAPYYREHRFATIIEKMLAKQLKVNWEEYNKSFDNLKWK